MELISCAVIKWGKRWRGGGGKRWGEVGGLLLKRRRERQKEGRCSLVSQKRDG